MCGDIDIWLSNMMPKLRTLSDGSMSSVPICKQTGGILHLLKDEVAMKNSVFESFNLSILFVIHSLISVMQAESLDKAHLDGIMFRRIEAEKKLNIISVHVV